MQAVILAGGKGTRLAERLHGRPKPLVDVGGVPLLARQIEALAAHGIDEVVLLVNHAADQIEAFVAQHPLPAKVTLIDDGAPRGTAGAVLASLDRLAPQFLCVYGDTLFDIDIGHMRAAHTAAGAAATLLLHPNDHPADSDLVEVDEDGWIRAFHPYPHPRGVDFHNLVNAAFYVIQRDALASWADVPHPCDFAKDLFPRMLAAGAPLHGYASYEYIKDLGTPKRLEQVERHLAAGVVARASRREKQAAVFLDRDGTLNVLNDYIRVPEEIVIEDGAREAVRAFNEAELRTVVVTNQPVLARGECDAEGMRRIHARLETLLGEGGAYLDRIELCPHHPDAGFVGEVPALKRACDCRKPGVAMIRRAMHDLNIDADRSWLVGDSTADLLAANRTRLRSVLVGTGVGGRDAKYTGVADYVVSNVGQAAELITRVYPALAERVAPIVAQIAPGALVLVGGLARSGKTAFAATLRSELRRQDVSAESLALDRWLRAGGARAAGVLGRFDLDEAEAVLAPWLAGGAASLDLPFYDRVKRRSLAGDPLDLAADTVLILEGVPALTRDWPTGRAVLRIYIGADEMARGARVLADLVARGATAQDAVAIHAARQADETTMIAGTAAHADMRLSLDDLLETLRP